MLCKVCREGLQGIWDPSKTKRVCLYDEFGVEPMPDSVFATVETYTNIKPYDPELRRPEHYMFGHHLTQESFEQSVRDGCVMCGAFTAMSDDEAPDPKIRALGYYSLFSISFEDCPFMCLYMNDTRGGFALSPHFGETENLNTHISPSTGDDATWATVQTWLDTCLQTHDRCNEKPIATFIPTRLLRLETANGGEPVFRMISNTEVDPGTRYITLSHCCTPEEGELRLATSTFARLSAVQPLSVLPSTFSDAFTVVERLGLTHLWIDRLCIIHDNASDQRTEASRTRHVFGNAFLSISATGASSSSSGLFFSRDPALVAPTVFDFPVDAAGTTFPHLSSLEIRTWGGAFSGEPLARNARAVQERLQAPRVVHFGSKMVFWECHGATCAEIHPCGVFEPMGVAACIPGLEIESPEKRSAVTRPWKALLNANNVWGQDDPVAEIFSDWFTILTMYSGCTETTLNDKLTALGGQVEDMKTLLRQRGCEETEYYAGMWKAMLPGGLLWNVSGTGTRPAAYRAPSWSWAAVDGRANFHDRVPTSDGLLCELLAVSTAPHPADDPRETAAGSIVLKGKLALGKLDRTLPPLAYLKQRMQLQSLVNPEGGTRLADSGDCSPSEYRYEWKVIFDTAEDIRDEVLCFLIRSAPSGAFGYALNGIALLQRDDGRYVRCGNWGLLVKTEEEALGIFQELPEQEVEIV